jgi:iron complex outermembrane receptor protein
MMMLKSSALSGAALCLINSSAWAQTPSTSDDLAAQPAPVAPAAGDAAAEGGLEDIVVTATRREERLQYVPVTVTAVTASTLATVGVFQMRNLTEIVPGFTGGRNISGSQPVIRGIGSVGVSVGDESNVAAYIDGVYQPNAYANFLELVEIERVEVLRGPQGTVFGRNATGGLINIITPDPSFNTRGKVAVRYGRTRNDAGDYDLRAYVTGALTENIAADFAGLYRKNEDYIVDLVRGGHVGGSRAINLRSKLLFQPSDDAEIVLTGEYFDQNSTEVAVQPFNNNTAARNIPGVILPSGPWQVSLTDEPALNVKRYSVALRTRFDLGGVNLETTTGYMDSTVYQMSDSDGSNILLGQVPVLTEADAISQEVRLLSTSGGRLDWILGAYAFHLDGAQDVDVQSSRGPGFPVGHTRLNPDVKTTSYSAFAEGTYQLAEPFFVTAGARFTTEERKFRQAVNGNQLPFGTAKKSFDKMTYRIALRYNFAERANVYASYGTGFKSGVFNTVGTSRLATDPETIKAWELGMKADPLPWLRTNVSLFHYDYDDLQVQARDTSGTLYILQNAASAEVYGGELEVTAAATPDLNIRASAASTHGEYTRFPAAQTFVPLANGGNAIVASNVSGKNMVRAPRYTFNIGGDWSQDLGSGRIKISGNVFRSGAVYYDFLNLFYQKAYTLVSGEIAWTSDGERFRLTLFGTNLTNAKVAQMLRPGSLGTDQFYERPRRIGIGAEMRF